MKKYCVMFPGQGVAFSGMGRSFYDTFDVSRSILQKIENILDMDLEKIIFNESDEIKQTFFAQKAIIATSVMIYEAVKTRLVDLPSAMIGFSLGEYTALYEAGVFSLEDLLKIIEKRSLWMEETANKIPSGMAALLGGDEREIEFFCHITSNMVGTLCIANYNSPVQKVVSGTIPALDYLREHLSDLNIKRMIPLSVNGGFHSPLMKDVASKMEMLVRKTRKNKPKNKVVMNCSGRYLNVDDLETLMATQMMGPVYFEKSIRFLISEGIDTFIEIGPGKVLSNLVKKIDSTATVISINNIIDLQELEMLG